MARAASDGSTNQTGGNGQAYGNGLFIQGDGSVTLSSVAGGTTTVTGLIADQSGSDPGNSYADPGAGRLVVAGSGTVVLQPENADGSAAVNSYTGGTTIEGGTLDLAVAGAAGSGAITFAPAAAATLQIDAAALPGSGGSFANVIKGFGGGDTINLSSLSYAGIGTATLLSGNVLQVQEDGQTYNVQFDPTQDFSGQFFHLSGPTGTDITVDAHPPVASTLTNSTPALASTAGAPVSPFANAAVSDVNIGPPIDTLTITLAGKGGILAGSGLVQIGATTYTLTGIAADVTSRLEALSFTPAAAGTPNGSAVTSFTLSDTNSANATPATDATSQVTETDAAATPGITGAVATATTSEVALTPFTGVTVADINAANGSNVASTATDTLTIALSGLGGTLTGNGLTQVSGSSYTLSGTAAAITSQIQALSFTPSSAGGPNSSAATSFTLTDASSAGTASAPAVATVTDTDPAVASTLTNTTPALASAAQAPVTPFADTTVSDANVGSPTEALTITLLGNSGTLAGSGLVQTSATTYALAGAAAAVTAQLQALSFTPNLASTPNGSAITTFALSDTNSANAIPATNATSQVTETDAAATPSITVPATAQLTSLGASVTPFAGGAVTDTNAADGANTASTAVDTLTLTLSSDGGTLTGTNLTQTGATSYMLTGTAAALTGQLRALSFTPNSAGAPNSSARTTFTLNDTSSAGTTNTATSVITTLVNDAPRLDGQPATAAATDEAALCPFAAVVLSDALSGLTQAATVQLSAANGTLSSLAGGTLSPDGLSYTVSGSAAGVQAALRGLVFTPLQNQVAPGSTISTTSSLSDTNGTSTAGASTVLAVQSINDAPIIGGTAAGQATSDMATIFPFAAVTVADPDIDQTETATVIFAPANGTVSDSVGAAGAGRYTVSGTPSQVQAALREFVFIPTAGQTTAGGSVTTGFALSVSDGLATVVDSSATVVATATSRVPPITATPTLEFVSASGATASAAKVENGQTSVIGTVAPGVPGDTLALTQSAGAGSLSLGAVAQDGTQQVIYTAPASITASSTDAVRLSVTEQQTGAVASGSVSIPLDAGPVAVAGSVSVAHGDTVDLATLIAGLVMPGLAGDTETITAVSGNARLDRLTGHVLYAAPATGQTDNVAFQVTDQLGGTAQSTVAIALGPVAPQQSNPTDFTYSPSAQGPNHFIDLANFEASFPDLVSAFGTNEQAMQTWYETFEPIENRVATFNGLDYVASSPDLIKAFGPGAASATVQDAGAAHFIAHGNLEGRTTTFNGLDYVASYQDLIKAFGVDSDAGAYHYIEFGANEGRSTTFNGLDYIASYKDLIDAYGANEQAGAAHFISNGDQEGRMTTFDGLAYIAGYSDLMLALGANGDAGADHYIQYGATEGRATAFDVTAYQAAHPDLQGIYANNDQFLNAYIDTYVKTGHALA